MPAAVLAILAGIQAAISAAPQVEAIVKSAKDMISALFSAGLIGKDQQDTLHAWVDNHAAMVRAGVTPPSWTVEADPA